MCVENTVCSACILPARKSQQISARDNVHTSQPLSCFAVKSCRQSCLRLWKVKTDLDRNEKFDRSFRSENAQRIQFIPDHYDCVFLSVSIVISFLPAAAFKSPTLALSTAHSRHSPMERKQRRKSIEKISLQAHTFLSCFERVSFNLSLISICCFWDSLAAH